MHKLRILLSVLLITEQAAVPGLLFAQASKTKLNPQFQQEMAGGAKADADKGVQDQDIAMPKAVTPGVPAETSDEGENSGYEIPESRNPLDRKISIRVTKASVTAFLDAISSQAKISFMAEGIENKTITAFLRDVTVRDALQLLRVRGLTYQRVGKSTTYLVTRLTQTGPPVVTRIYTLSFISLLPSGSEKQDMDSITSQDVTATSTFSQEANSSGSTGGASGGQGGQQGGIANANLPANAAESGIAILNVIRSVLTRAGKLAIEPRTNSIIITDVPESFPQVEQILAELDKKAPQILIEAQIVEINTDRMNELGITWGGTKGELASFTGGARQTDYFLRTDFFKGNSWQNFFPTNLTSSSGGSSSGSSGYNFNSQGIDYGVFSLKSLEVILRALISRSEARYLGKPKIVALNNKTAIITASRDAAVSLGTVVASAGGGTTQSQVERRRVGLTLKVTPQVNNIKEGYITLLVQPSYVDSVSSSISANIYDPVSRGASTLVRVKNGQTVVIGGMLSSTDTKVVRKVPLLGYIPIVGWLFTSTSHRRQNTDLVLFLTPTILVD